MKLLLRPLGTSALMKLLSFTDGPADPPTRGSSVGAAAGANSASHMFKRRSVASILVQTSLKWARRHHGDKADRNEFAHSTKHLTQLQS